jgi:cytidylate kinase
LRVKESDRLQAILDGLATNGIRAEAEGDTLRVFGAGAGKTIPGGGKVATRMDHRIAMSFLVLGLVSDRPVKVDDSRSIATSFPGFAALMKSIGAQVQSTERRPMIATSIQAGVLRPNVPRRVIAIDGPAASGKGTLARRIAEHYGYAYLDTGSLYRAVGLRMVKNKLDPADREQAVATARAITDQDLMDPDLRMEKVGKAASVVSAIPEVRDILLEYQREYAHRPEGAILDGRDIGTVVCPEADFKLFMTASIEARARRRHKELQGQGIKVVYESVLEDLLERDKRDSRRKAAPLHPAPDAVTLDTTQMSAEAVFQRVLGMIEERTSKARAQRA